MSCFIVALSYHIRQRPSLSRRLFTDHRADPIQDGRIHRDRCEDQDVRQGRRHVEEFKVREHEGPRDAEDDGNETFGEESLRGNEVRAEEEVEAREDEFSFHSFKN